MRVRRWRDGATRGQRLQGDTGPSTQLVQSCWLLAAGCACAHTHTHTSTHAHTHTRTRLGVPQAYARRERVRQAEPHKQRLARVTLQLGLLPQQRGRLRRRFGLPRQLPALFVCVWGWVGGGQGALGCAWVARCARCRWSRCAGGGSRFGVSSCGCAGTARCSVSSRVSRHECSSSNTRTPAQTCAPPPAAPRLPPRPCQPPACCRCRRCHCCRRRRHCCRRVRVPLPGA
jgi:hypothetical protein